MTLGQQVAELFLLALPIACIPWTVTHEDLFREPREWCTWRSRSRKRLVERKFFYLFTCEYCRSHYVTVFILFIMRSRSCSTTGPAISSPVSRSSGSRTFT